MTLSSFISCEISQNADRVRGLAYLMGNFQPGGSGPHDGEARSGIGLILEDIAESGRRLATLAEIAEDHASFEVNVDWEKPDPIGQVERQAERLGEIRKEAK